MVKAVIGALVGIIIIALGVYVWYVFVSTLDQGSNNFLFGLSVVQIGVGMYVLFWASKNSDPLHLHRQEKGKGNDILEKSELMREELMKTDIEGKFIKVEPKG